jgi:hypothetical protein
VNGADIWWINRPTRYRRGAARRSRAWLGMARQGKVNVPLTGRGFDPVPLKAWLGWAWQCNAVQGKARKLTMKKAQFGLETPMTTTRFDYYICHMGDDVRMAYTATDAIEFAQRGEPIDNNGFRRRFMGEDSYILHVNPDEGTCRDVTEDLAHQWQADNPHETDIPTVFDPYVEPLNIAPSDRQEHGTYHRNIGL